MYTLHFVSSYDDGVLHSYTRDDLSHDSWVNQFGVSIAVLVQFAVDQYNTHCYICHPHFLHQTKHAGNYFVCEFLFAYQTTHLVVARRTYNPRTYNDLTTSTFSLVPLFVMYDMDIFTFAKQISSLGNKTCLLIQNKRTVLTISTLKHIHLQLIHYCCKPLDMNVISIIYSNHVLMYIAS